MPDENTTTAATPAKPEPAKPELPPLITEPISVTRNGVSINAVDAKKEKGKSAGEHFVSLDPHAPFNLLAQWVGLDEVTQIVRDYVRRTFQGITAICVSGTPPVLDITSFLKYATEFEAREESMSELKAQSDALVLQLIGINLSDENEKVKAMELMGKIQSIQASIALKVKAKAVAASAAADEN